jgi:hypothetical protein
MIFIIPGHSTSADPVIENRKRPQIDWRNW